MNRHLSNMLLRTFVTLAVLNVSRGIRIRQRIGWLIVPEIAVLAVLFITIVAEVAVWRSERSPS